MPTFDELMEQFRNPGETGLPENFADELASAYREDLSVRDAAVQAREEQIAEAQAQVERERAENLRLKAVNYDLLIAAPKAGNPADKKEPDNGDAPRGIDSLFE